MIANKNYISWILFLLPHKSCRPIAMKSILDWEKHKNQNFKNMIWLYDRLLSILNAWKTSIIIGASTDWRSIICAISFFALTICNTLSLFPADIFINAVTYSKRSFRFAHVWYHILHLKTYIHYQVKMNWPNGLEEQVYL